MRFSAFTPFVVCVPLVLAGCDSDTGPSQATSAKAFERVSTFFTCEQLSATCNTDQETSAEIVAVSSDGMSAVYTNSLQGALGFVDLTNPADPKALGEMPLDGEPTSVAVKGDYALVGLNTSQSFSAPSGALLVIDMDTQSEVARFDLGGQPDSVAVSPDQSYAAVAIENERDEDLADGQIDVTPQLPAGFVVSLSTADANPANWSLSRIEVTGLASVAPSDPEPEFVDINSNNIAAVTLQENNHVVLIDLASNQVVNHFSAGFSDLNLIDTTEEGVIDQSSSLSNVAREPDGVTWIGTEFLAVADEGDMNGGSRSFTVFNAQGEEVYNAGATLDHLAARYGQYNEDRSANKGSEPENLTYAEFEGTPYLFVNLERSSLVLAFDVTNPEAPVFKQALPALLAPEGAKAVSSRGLLIVASEEDSRSDGFRGGLNIYQLTDSDTLSYPSLVSVDRDNGTPVPFSALSSLAAGADGVLYSVEDSAFAQTRLLTLDTSAQLPRVVAETKIRDTNGVLAAVLGSSDLAAYSDSDQLINSDGSVNLDAEGLALASDGGFWLASEGSGSQETPNLIVKLDSAASIEAVYHLPVSQNAQQTKFGFEGVSEFAGKLYVVQQRAWSDTQPRIWVLDLQTEQWSHAFYPLDAVESVNGGWVGLSEITSVGQGKFYLIERDNQAGFDAAVKRIYQVDLSRFTPGQTLAKTLVRDLLVEGDLTPTHGMIPEKIESLALDSAGNAWIVNDNDALDDNSGEQMLINLGQL